jgi:hypothetical protein
MRWLRSFWVWFTSWFRRMPKPYRIVRASDVPDEAKPGVLYLVGEGEYLWFAAFVCPCDCKELVQLSLLADSRPRWRVEEHTDGTASLHPSIWRQKGCRSHFFLNHGFIVWAQD